MHCFILDFYKIPLNHPKSSVENADLSFFLWSYYDMLHVTKVTAEVDLPKLFPAIRHSAVFYDFPQTQSTILQGRQVPISSMEGGSTIFDKNIDHPLLLIAQFSLNPELLTVLSQEQMNQSAMEEAGRSYEKVYLWLSKLAEGIQRFLSNPPVRHSYMIQIMGSLGTSDLVLVLRSSNYFDMMKLVDNLLTMQIDDIDGNGGPFDPLNFPQLVSMSKHTLIESSYILLGGSVDVLSSQGDQLRDRWSKNEQWDKLMLILDIGMSPPADFDKVKKEFSDINDQNLDVMPQFGKYGALIQVQPNSKTPNFYKQQYGEAKLAKQRFIQLVQSHWMLKESVSHQREYSNTADRQLVSLLSKQEALGKLFNEDLELLTDEGIDTTMLGDLYGRISYIFLTQDQSLGNVLYEQFENFLKAVKDALQSGCFEKGSFFLYLLSINELTSQLQQGSKVSFEGMNSHPFFHGSRAKIILAHLSFFASIMKKINDNYKSNTVSNIYSVMSDIPRLRSFIPFPQSKNKSAIIKIPLKNMIFFSKDIPSLLHEIFHYVAPKNRRVRNELLLKSVIFEVFYDIFSLYSNAIIQLFCEDNGFTEEEEIKGLISSLPIQVIEKLSIVNLMQRFSQLLDDAHSHAFEMDLRTFTDKVLKVFEKDISFWEISESTPTENKSTENTASGSIPTGVEDLLHETLVLYADILEAILFEKDQKTTGNLARQVRKKKIQEYGVKAVLDHYSLPTKPNQNTILDTILNAELFFKEVRADWAMCCIANLDVKGYYTVLRDYIPDINTEKAPNPYFVRRVGFISRMLDEANKWDTSQFIIRCEKVLREVFADSESRFDYFLNCLKDYTTEKNAAMEAFMWDAIFGDWCNEFKELAPMGALEVVKDAYQDKESLSSSVKRCLHFWLQTYNKEVLTNEN